MIAKMASVSQIAFLSFSIHFTMIALYQEMEISFTSFYQKPLPQPDIWLSPMLLGLTFINVLFHRGFPGPRLSPAD